MSTMQHITCPQCGHGWKTYRNPLPTVDAIIEYHDKVLLITRKNPPHGLALPGGFVDYGESVEAAVIREAAEETRLRCTIVHLLGVYSSPLRDPRHHTISTVFVVKGQGTPKAQDDAASLSLYDPYSIPSDLAFDHRLILNDYLTWKRKIRRNSN